jgi:hypothetical protein
MDNPQESTVKRSGIRSFALGVVGFMACGFCGMIIGMLVSGLLGDHAGYFVIAFGVLGAIFGARAFAQKASEESPPHSG